MTITMQNTRTPTIQEMNITALTDNIVFKIIDRSEAYIWIEQILRGICYFSRNKKEKGIIQCYIQKLTGYKSAQTKRLIRCFGKTETIQLKKYQRTTFPCKYNDDDVALLANVDLAHGRLSAPATRHIMEREFTIYGKKEYRRLADISPSHIYNLRGKKLYREKTGIFEKTKPTSVPIGERRKPRPNGKPGFIRVDTVHQGDAYDGCKGVYHINLVDEVTQWEIVVCVERITERYMIPALEAALEQFPFVTLGFHADNGSEYINYKIADILERMRIKLTKSRPRHSGDNGLVETKNGAIIRKYLGYCHIPQPHAGTINQWYCDHFNHYLNFHRPSAYAKEVIDKKGKRKRTYPLENYKTPYEKLHLLTNACQYLKPGITFDSLDKIAYAESDTEYAERMQKEKMIMFKTIFR